MKPAWYKVLISYVRELELEHVEGSFNEELHVILSKGRYQLCTENAIYSYADKYDNFKLSFNLLDWNAYNIEKVLLLGLGLASIPYILETKLNKNFHYTAVEIDEVVVSLAQKYVIDDLNSPMEIITGDAYIYMETNSRKYDLILMDVFIDDVIPKKFKSKKYFEFLNNALNDNGVIIYNVLNLTDKDKKKAEKFYQKFSDFFKGAWYKDIKGNKMIFYNKKSK